MEEMVLKTISPGCGSVGTGISDAIFTEDEMVFLVSPNQDYVSEILKQNISTGLLIASK